MQTNWPIGLAYMGAVLAILLTHEMGHFLQTVKYGIPASFPLCIPVPFNPIGTMGAVIGTDDRVIPVDVLRRMAERAGSTVSELDASHVSMVSHPDVTVAAITAAATTLES